MKSLEMYVPRAGLEMALAALSDAVGPCGWKECPTVRSTAHHQLLQTTSQRSGNKHLL